MHYTLTLNLSALLITLLALWAIRRDNLKHAAEYKRFGDTMIAADEKITILTKENELLRTSRDTWRSAAVRKAIPENLTLKVTTQGVAFGKAWYSHEKITGRTAEQLNTGKGGLVAQQYMAWVDTVHTALATK